MSIVNEQIVPDKIKVDGDPYMKGVFMFYAPSSTVQSNPYPAGSREYSQWAKGYESCREMYETDR
jgi:hypothetical protein